MKHNFKPQTSNFKLLLITLIILIKSVVQTMTAQAIDNNQSTIINKIDSLRQVIKTAKHDTTRINAYSVWGEEIYMQLPDSAIALWKIAETIANKLLATHPPTNVADTAKKQLASALNNIGYIYYNQGDIPKALEYYNKSLNIREEIGDKKGMANSFNNIGMIYMNQGDIPKALEYFNKSLNIREEIGDKKGMAISFNNIGFIYCNQGDIPKALEYYNKSLNIREEIGDKKGMATSFNNFGLIYNEQGDIPKALEYYNKSLNIREEIGDKQGMANSFNNIGAIYKNQGALPKVHPVERVRLLNRAIEYYNKSLNIQEEIGDKQGMAYSFNNIGMIYNNQGALPKVHPVERVRLLNRALEYYNKSLNIREEIGDKKGMAISFNNIGSLYFEKNNIARAKSYIEKGYKLSKELGYPFNIEKCAGWLKKIYLKQGNYKLAYEFYTEEVLMHDSIQNEENFKKTMQQHAKYEYEKAAAVAEIAHTKAMEIKDLQMAKIEEEKKKQRIIIMFVVCGLLLVVVFSVFLFRLFMQKKKANVILARQKQQIEIQNSNLNQANEEITAQRDEISAQRDLVTKQKEHIEEIHKEVTDSINYAKRIQEAMLPQLSSKSQIPSSKLQDLESEKLQSSEMFIEKEINPSPELQSSEIFIEKETNTTPELRSSEMFIEKETNTTPKLRSSEMFIEKEINTTPELQSSEIFIENREQSLVGSQFATSTTNDKQQTTNIFILFKPKDVVSGDFYWFSQVNEYQIYAVADCTGHGVPGAFMSMLGISFLNEIVRKKEVTQASHVLDQLRVSIIDALRQTGGSGTQKDGMDMSIVVIKSQVQSPKSQVSSSKLQESEKVREGESETASANNQSSIDNNQSCHAQWAGANNPLWLVRSRQSLIANNQSSIDNLIEFKPDKMPIAIYEKMNRFTNHEITLCSGDTIYLMSDGYEDQFGGPKGKKFLSKNLKELIIANCLLTMEEQKQILEKTLIDWIGEGEQIDDITILGIRI